MVNQEVHVKRSNCAKWWVVVGIQNPIWVRVSSSNLLQWTEGLDMYLSAMHKRRILCGSSLVMTCFICKVFFVLFARYWGCCHMLMSHSGCQNCLYSLNFLLLLARCAADEPTRNAGGLWTTRREQKQGMCHCLPTLDNCSHYSLSKNSGIYLVVLLSVADIAITLIAVLQFQHHFPPYPISLQCYTQEVYSPGKVVDFRDEGLWWRFTVVNGNLCIEFLKLFSSFAVFIDFLYVPACLPRSS